MDTETNETAESAPSVVGAATPTVDPRRPHPSRSLASNPPLEPDRPGLGVDLRRCIGCHACSVACKTAHEIPLGEFPLRVRWLPRPDGRGYAFLPVFSESLCQDDPESTRAGLAPACVRACPTEALVWGDLADDRSGITELARRPDARRLTEVDGARQTPDLKRDVAYLALEDWMGRKLNRGAALDPRDEDPIYEQR